jgi:thioredoxin-related protein
MKSLPSLAPCCLLAALTLASCAKVGKSAPDKAPNPIGLAGKPLVRVSGNDEGTPVQPGQPILPPGSIPDEDNIVRTNPDDPDEVIPELDSVLANVARGPWEESETVAKQRAVREGKPLLIWFTNSQGSPMCKALSEELFSTTEFGEWATENLVRLRVDELISKSPDLSMDETDERRINIKNYNAALKKRYKVLGYPSLVMLNPSGEVVGRYRGYKRGESELLWGQLKHGAAVSQEAYKGWRTGMEKKGYREWSGKRGQKIFAKLISYSKGNLVLVEPDGQRAKTKESNLSESDRVWIAEQKKLRSIQ